MGAITQFGGIFPRTPWHLLPENAATKAHNVKLRNGKLEPWRETKKLSVAVPEAKTLVAVGCCMMTWDTCVSTTEYLPDYNRLYLTGRVDRPEVAVLDPNCNPTYFYLGAPEPIAAPRLSFTEATGRDCSARAYVYTFVNIFGEESAPSTPSQLVSVRDGDPVVLMGMETPPAGYGVVNMRIYRSSTAYRTGAEKEQDPLTDYMLVAEIEYTTSFTDALLEKFLGPVLNTREVRLPPKALRNISHVVGTGALVGVTNNQVHFSQNFQPYSWPAEYDMTLNHNIVNMVTIDQQAIVSTDGYPYVVSAAPNCEARKCRAVNEVDIPLPDISCGYANSAIATPFGMVYSSKDGLVLVSTDAKFQVITSAWYSTDDWVKIRPDTVRLAYWRGYLICVTDVVSFMLEIDGNTYQDFKLGAMVTLSDQPVDMWVSTNGELLLLQDQIVSQWNAGSTLRPYIWESREMHFGGTASPNTAKLKTTGIEFRLLTPVGGLDYTRFIMNDKPFRLGRLGRHLYYRMGFYGIGVVEHAELGTANVTINQGK